MEYVRRLLNTSTIVLHRWLLRKYTLIGLRAEGVVGLMGRTASRGETAPVDGGLKRRLIFTTTLLRRIPAGAAWLRLHTCLVSSDVV